MSTLAGVLSQEHDSRSFVIAVHSSGVLTTIMRRHPNLLHGQIKTPRDEPIEYGCYLGYLPAISRDKYRTVCGVDEQTDRKESYQQGCAPKLWPSLDKIHYYPKK